jgi:hypothetical protein
MGSVGFSVWVRDLGLMALGSALGVGSSGFRFQARRFRYQGEGVREEVLVVRVQVCGNRLQGTGWSG